LKLQKAFENRQDRPWPAFKSGVSYIVRFSKDNCLIVKMFGRFQNRQVGSVRLLKAFGAALRNPLSNRSKELNLPVLKSFRKFNSFSR
jgi:hypothetical protein